MTSDERLERLLDQRDIEAVLARYCRGVDRGDEALLAACYHPDGTDDHGTFVGLGSDFARWAVSGAASVWVASHHTVHNVLIDWVDVDVARVESAVLAFNHRRAAEEVEVFAGRYVDRFERREGAWKIGHRLALRDVDTVVERRRWAGKITPGARFPHDPIYG